MWMRDRALAGVASQLGHPAGVAGRVIARVLNRENRSVVENATEASAAGEGDDVADIGFGGGVGLQLLLDRVGSTGSVHGAEVSRTMLSGARRRYRRDLRTGRLLLYEAGMTDLPLADASLDALISTNTVYFIDELEPAFAELARVLRPGARAVLGVGDPVAMARMPYTQDGFRLRSVAEIDEALKSGGLAPLQDRRLGDGDTAYHLLVCTAP